MHKKYLGRGDKIAQLLGMVGAKSLILPCNIAADISLSLFSGFKYRSLLAVCCVDGFGFGGDGMRQLLTAIGSGCIVRHGALLANNAGFSNYFNCEREISLLRQ